MLDIEIQLLFTEEHLLNVLKLQTIQPSKEGFSRTTHWFCNKWETQKYATQKQNLLISGI